MGQVGEVLVNLFTPLLVAGAIGFVALGIGSFLVRLFVGGERAFLVESFAFGTLAISLLTLMWGIFGWLGVYARLSLALPLILLGIAGWLQARPGWPLNPASFKNRTILILSLLLAVGVLLRIVLSPLYPAVGLDECRTHLPAVFAILDSGYITYHPDIAFSGFPQGAEMLYVWAVAYSPLTAAHYVNFLAYFFCILALIRLGRTVFSIKTGWLAALIMASMGALQIPGGDASPNIWVLFFILAAVLVLTEGMRDGSPGRVLLAGIFLGAAAGVSYTGLLASLTLAISLFAIGRKSTGIKPIPGWIFILTVILVCIAAAPWYIRNAVWFNNPVFPFYESVFPPGGGIYGIYGPESAVRIGWMHGTETAVGYFQHGELWPVILSMWSTWIVIPAGIWFWRESPFIRVAITWTVLVWAFWMIGGGGIIHFPYYIYLIPVNVLVLAHLLGVVYSLPPGDKRGRFFRIVLWTILIGWIGIAGARTSQLIPPLTSTQIERTLGRVHGSYELIMAANESIAEDRVAVGILCEDGRLYADFILLGGGDVGWARHRIISDSCTSPEELAVLLREHYGANYLIVHEERLTDKKTDEFLRINRLLRSPEFSSLFREVARVGRGAVYYVESPG